MTLTDTDTVALQVLQRHAKSFSWGGFFLPRPNLLAAARLYHFCRVCDDLVDESAANAQTLSQLQEITQALQGPATAEQPLFLRAFLETAEQSGIDTTFAQDLLSGLRQDLGEVCMPDRKSLLRYCYRVAGTVGGMMCPLLEVSDPAALPFAVDLGIAMQLTNICRDVAEDAENGRVYLPADLLAEHGLSPQHLLEPELRHQLHSQQLAPVLREVLALAERYYLSGYQGLDFIPARTRFAIWVAARLYQGIGRKIVRTGYPVLQQRVQLSKAEKLREVAKAGLAFMGSSNARETHIHAHELHQPLAGTCPCCQELVVGSHR